MPKQKPWFRTWFAGVTAGVVFCAGLMAFIANSLLVKQQLAFTEPPEHLMGWAGPEKAKEAWSELKGKFPKFKIVGEVKSSEGANVKLWKHTIAVTGSHLPTIRQEIGDCVSQGSKNGVEYLLCGQIVKGELQSFEPVAQYYHYAYGRMIIGKGQIRGPDGSVGSWQADGVREGGVLPMSFGGGMPEYNGKVSSQWAVRKPEAKYIAEGKRHTVVTTAMVTTYEEVRDAIANGYPVVICSNVGFAMQPRVDGGKHFGSPQGTWNHCMVLVGIDDTVKAPSFAGNRSGKKGAAYCLNSWGPDAHGSPADDAPPGGFWISRDVIVRMVSQEDSFAYSGLNGFLAAPPEWDFGFDLAL